MVLHPSRVDAAFAPVRTGLRERKRERTRVAILDVALTRFADVGYHDTTLREVADAAEVGLSTLQRYFPAKTDIVFFVDRLCWESLRRHIATRDPRETAIRTIVSWVQDSLPEVDGAYARAFRLAPIVKAANPDLHEPERLWTARFEDLFATLFARDLDVDPDAVSAHTLGTLAMRSFMTIWQAWYSRHSAEITDAVFTPSEAFGSMTAELERVLDAGLAFATQLRDSAIERSSTRPDR